MANTGCAAALIVAAMLPLLNPQNGHPVRRHRDIF
jgi:hypothetical protein